MVRGRVRVRGMVRVRGKVRVRARVRASTTTLIRVRVDTISATLIGDRSRVGIRIRIKIRVDTTILYLHDEGKACPRAYLRLRLSA